MDKLLNDAAFARFEENVVWHEDKSPHFSAAFPAIVNHGEAQSESAGHARARVPGDPWTVIAPRIPSEVCRISEGDTLTREDGTVLFIHQVTKDHDLGWVFVCTVHATAPLK